MNETFVGRGAILTCSVVVLASVGGAVYLADSGGTQSSRLSDRAATKAQATTSVAPSYLPAGVTPHQQVTKAAASGSSAHVGVYDIAGTANANTDQGVTLTLANATDTSLHPGTDIVMTFVPGITSTPELPTFPSNYQTTTVQVGGNDATLNQAPSGGPGVERLDWVDADGYHTVICDRLITSKGLSGVSAADLTRMAQSLYS